ncbi:hypothetical protein BMS3Abin12_00823 [bacterium BMS3Abin12]|nr:hypothetical protein BMS3Abin12_00823 [bacterium BMS3Abin12]
MAHIGLISCASKKRSSAAQAKDLYVSALFAKSREFVEQRCDSWFILSAKYGLVEPIDVIEPYEKTLNTKPRRERDEWADRVWALLHQRLTPGDHVTILAGERYRESLVPLMTEYGCHVDVPMQGLGIGRQLQWLSHQLQEPQRDRDIARLYQALRRLESRVGGKRLMSECTAQQGWPNSGVYLFFEPGELRTNRTEPRVVRVGTHGVSRGSKATLWNRLRTHRGTRDGVGNHRSSIFRLHVGAAISARDHDVMVASWGVGQAADVRLRKAEEGLERRVSAHVGAMSILWLAIKDEASPSSDRAYIERNLIGMLVGKAGPADPPSLDWLGRFSPDERIRLSGLWNLDFLDYTYSPDCLDVFEEYVLITTGKRPQPSGSIAPRDWYTNDRQGAPSNQLSLFGD